VRLLSLTLLLALSAASPSAAFVWPSTIERVEKKLYSGDPKARRQAAERLVDLPERTARRLLDKALSDSDSAVRVAAAEAALALRATGVGDRVIGWLNDPERRVRLAAAEVLRESPTERALPALGRVLGDPDAGVRMAAARALGASEHPDAVLPLVGRLDDVDPAVRREVIAALGSLADQRAVVPLIGKIQDPRADVRAQVAYALGQHGDSRAQSVLMLALRDADESVRVSALEALGRLAEPSSVLPIVSVVREFPPSRVQVAALEALGKIRTTESINALIEVLGSSHPHAERAAARRALAMIGKPALGPLERCLAGQNSRELSEGCAQALGDIGTARGRRAITDALRRNVVPPEAALGGLGHIGQSEALPTLLEFLTHPQPVVRLQAIEAIDKTLDPSTPDGRAVEPIVAALRRTDISPSERVQLTRLLGRSGSARALKVLEPLARSADDQKLRVTAIEALGLLGQARQDAVLIASLDDEEPAVRLAAALALQKSGGAESTRALLDRLSRAAAQDRTALVIALGGPLSRTRDPSVVLQVEKLITASRGAERDALIEAMGRIALPEAANRLAELARNAVDTADRVKVSEALAAHAAARDTLRLLAKDASAAVRASAVWALGSAADKQDLALLKAALRDRDVQVAGNAAAALARLSVRLSVPVVNELCGALEDSRSYVRANALSALRVVKARCKTEKERQLLVRDRSDVVRRAAARLLVNVPRDNRKADAKVLARCVEREPSGSVASACSAPPDKVSGRSETVTVYVVPVGESAPAPETAFALVLPDGLMRLGVTDRRGAVFEHRAPRGFVSLTVPASSVR
jgi:HEAT repeat protein